MRLIGAGAAEEAPTAPHATPRPWVDPSHRPSGPERFWTSAWWRTVYAAALLLSLVLHYAALPGSFLPKHDFEVHDVDGTLTIPVDLLNEGPPPPPPPPEAPKAAPTAEPETPGETAAKKRDAGPVDAALSDVLDAGKEAEPDAEPRDAGSDGPVDAEATEDAGVALADEAGAPGSARDAVGMIGAAGQVQAGPQNVVLTVSMAALRAHPVGKRMGPLIMVTPQWSDFVQGTDVDPLRDIDWISINGPALLHTEKDVIMVHYSVPDAAVDKALGVLAKKSKQGGPTNLGVPGVKATKGYADRAERVFLRPQAHVLAVVPAYYAKTAAQILSRAAVPRTLKRPSEALRLTLVHPHGPMPGIPETVTELRLWIVPRNDDGGADVYGEGDTADAAACQDALRMIDRLIRDQNSFGVQLVTHGLLNRVELEAEDKTLKMHVSASREQIEVVLSFIGGQLGVPFAPEPAPSGSAARPPR